MTYVDSKNSDMTPTDTGTAATSEGPQTTTKFCTKSLIASMLITVVLFSFTLSGMMSAGTWVVDRYLMPRLETVMKLQAPSHLPTFPTSEGSDAAASVR